MHTKLKIVAFLKQNRFFYQVYTLIGTTFLNVIGLFIRKNDKLIIFNSFGGKKYDDSPKVIYELMKKDCRFDEYELVWAFHEPDKFPNVEKKIKSDNFNYFIQLLRARCWITNSSVQRGMSFKTKNTLYFNTWHGSPIKKMGRDADDKLNVKLMQSCNVLLGQSLFEQNTMSKAYLLESGCYKVFGLPRNDELACVSKEHVQEIRKKLGIPIDKKVILYAPTFRDYLLNDDYSCKLEIPIDFKKWNELLGEKYVFLVRAHYEVVSHTKIPDDSNWIDVSNYPSLNELMIASDVLISDYSSIIFDYSILGKPIFSFCYDYDEYNAKRGMYFDIRNWFSFSDNSIQLALMIKDMNEEFEKQKSLKFRRSFVQSYGDATKKSVDYIYQLLH